MEIILLWTILPVIIMLVLIALKNMHKNEGEEDE